MLKAFGNRISTNKWQADAPLNHLSMSICEDCSTLLRLFDSQAWNNVIYKDYEWVAYPEVVAIASTPAAAAASCSPPNEEALCRGKGLFVNSHTRSLLANEGNETTRKDTSP